MLNYTGPRGLFREAEIMRTVQNLPGDGTVLEIGAGKMSLTFKLANHFSRVTAIDLSPNIHSLAGAAPASLRAKIDTAHGDFLTMPLEGQFDLIVACEVLEHVPEEQAFIERIDGLLKPGGMMIISVPAHMKFWSRHDDLVGHLRRYSRADLENVARWLPHDQIRIIAYGYPWINLLRIFRVKLAGILLKEHEQHTVEERTIASGQLHPQLRLLNLVVNPFTVAPFALFSRLFNHTDYSDGYLLFVRKRLPDS